jgi:CheY-like chemotaxis protein
MSLPHLLLVDDSDAIIAFERAALSGHYTLSSATNGKEALEKASQLLPDAILLDLSMPVMGGDEVLRHLKASSALKSIPVIIISSEKLRAEQCLAAGAEAFLEKPLRADALVSLVGKVLDKRREREREGSLAVLFVQAGGLEVGIPLEAIRGVVDHPATLPVPAAPEYLSRYFEYHGEPILILDLPQRLGGKHQIPLLDRKLVIVSQGGVSIAVSVDGVKDPEEFQREDVTERKRLGGEQSRELETLRAMVRTSRGPLPVIETRALLTGAVLEDVRSALSGLAPEAAGQSA